MIETNKDNSTRQFLICEIQTGSRNPPKHRAQQLSETNRVARLTRYKQLL